MKPYVKYGEYEPEPLTPQCAVSGGGVSGKARKQATASQMSEITDGSDGG